MNRGCLGWPAILPQVAFLLVLAVSARAQTYQSAVPERIGVPHATQGSWQNRDQPVNIDSARLEVRKSDRMAIFSGDVHLSRGDTSLWCKTLVVYYEEDGLPAARAAPPGSAGPQPIRRLEAEGGIRLNQGDRTAVADGAVFDMRMNTVTLTGNVVVTPGASAP